MVMAMTEPRGAFVDFDMAVAACRHRLASQTSSGLRSPGHVNVYECSPTMSPKQSNHSPMAGSLSPLLAHQSPINLNCNNAAAFSYKKILSRLNERYNRAAQIVGGKLHFLLFLFRFEVNWKPLKWSAFRHRFKTDLHYGPMEKF